MSAVLTPSVPATSSTLAGRLRGFHSGAGEIDDHEVIVRGELPAWLSGSLLLNGPALWDLPRGRFAHWFDGLAMLHRLAFRDGQVRYRSRFLCSDAWRRSCEASRPAASAFGTDDPAGRFDRLGGLRVAPTNDNACAALSRIGPQWVASADSPCLVAFDPHTLATTGLLSPYPADLPMMSAHGHTDRQGNHWNVGLRLGPGSGYALFRTRPGAHRAETVATIPLAAPGYLHSFAMTRRHAIVWESALRAQPLGFRLTGRAAIRNFDWRPGEGSALHAISLDTGEVQRWEAPPLLCFHAVQAFERGDELVVELCTYRDAAVIDDLFLDERRQGAPMRSIPRLVRYRLQHGRREALLEPIGEAFELPQVHPGCLGRTEARIAWGAGTAPNARGAFFDRTVRIDLTTGRRQEWCRGDAVQLEPLYVPRPHGCAEDDGVLLVPTLADDDVATMIAVLDAKSLLPMAMLQAPQVIPFGFHAAFAASP